MNLKQMDWKFNSYVFSRKAYVFCVLQLNGIELVLSLYRRIRHTMYDIGSQAKHSDWNYQCIDRQKMACLTVTRNMHVYNSLSLQSIMKCHINCIHKLSLSLLRHKKAKYLFINQQSQQTIVIN